MDLQSLRTVDMFKNLDNVQLAHLASIMSGQELKKNEILFRENDAAEHFYIIEKGRIRISKIVPGIGEEALAILDAGAYFGEMELLVPGLTRAAQAMAHEHCSLQVISYQDFHDLLKADGELALAFLWSMVETLSNRLRATNDKVTAMFALAQF